MPETSSHGTIIFTKLIVGDLDRAAAFYCDVLGLRQTARLREKACGREVDEIILAPAEGPTAMILLSFPDAPAPVTGEAMLGVKAPDIATFLKRVEAAGGAVAHPIETFIVNGKAFEVAFAADCEGHLIEVLQG